MRILVISFYYEPDLSAGSFRATAFVNAMLEQLPTDAHIDVITTLPNRYSSFTSEAPEFDNHENLTVHRISLSAHKSGMLDQSKAFVGYAKSVIRLAEGKDYDLVFATSSRLMTAALGAYVSSKNGKPLYLDIRDIFVDTIKDVLPKKITWVATPLFSLLEGWTLRAANKVNLVSEGFLPYFELRYPNSRFSYFTNGIDEEFIKAKPEKPIPSIEKVLTVVYAGNIGKGQGLHTIIPELGRRFAGRLKFKLIGDGGQQQQLISAVAASGLGNVEILPPMRRDELIKIYQDADILFLHLNDYDAFKKVLPSKLFEYGALGKPIWAGVAGYAADFIRENISNAAVFCPCNADDAVKSLESLEMVTQPRSTFVERFARSNIMQKMAEDVISIAGGTRACQN
jgi:hypothetical protein